MKYIVVLALLTCFANALYFPVFEFADVSGTVNENLTFELEYFPFSTLSNYYMIASAGLISNYTCGELYTASVCFLNCRND